MLQDRPFTKEQTLLVVYDHSWLRTPDRLTLEMLAATGMLAGAEACVLLQETRSSSSRSIDAVKLTKSAVASTAYTKCNSNRDSLSSSWHLLRELNEKHLLFLCKLKTWGLGGGVILSGLDITWDGGSCHWSEHSPRNLLFPLVKQVSPSNWSRLWIRKSWFHLCTDIAWMCPHQYLISESPNKGYYPLLKSPYKKTC